jgi:predicted transcriptional regulator of viral defense system
MSIKSLNKQTGLSKKERLIIDTLVGHGKQIVRVEDLTPLLGQNASNPNLILSRLTKKGWLQRLRAGTYRIVPLGSDSANPVPEDAWLIATEIFSPCYMGGWTAAEHWDLTEQIFNKTIVITGKKQRTTEHSIAGLLFRTRTISAKHIFGTQKIWSHNVPIQISDMHRTLIDILDDPSIGGGGRAAIDIAKIYAEKKEANPEVLLQYALQLECGAVFKRLGFVGENILRMPETFLEQVHRKCKSGIIMLDPQGPKTGPVFARWGIRINIPLADIP